MVTTQPISVLLERFEDVVGRGLRVMIGEDEHLELIASDVPHTALEAELTRRRPRIAILNFGSLARPSEVRDLHRAVPDTRLLVLANRPSQPESRQMLAFGATACLPKSAEARDILQAIHLASRGLQVLPPIVPAAATATCPDLLTARETQVLELLASGHANAEIAAALQVSVETVRTHARHVYRKLGVSTRRELRSNQSARP